MVEGYPHDLQGEKMRSQFLYSATRSLFEEVGFSYERPKGKKNCVMRTTGYTCQGVSTGSRRVNTRERWPIRICLAIGSGRQPLPPRDR